MMITYSETFEIVTQESAKHGDAEQRGFIAEDEHATFREMVELLRHCEPSCYPVDATEPEFLWYTDSDYHTDYETGAVESRSYHPADSKSARYMLKAWRVYNAI